MQKNALISAQMDWKDQKMQTQIKESFGKNLTPEEWGLFLAIGEFTGLNPFLREIYAVKYGKSPASIIIGRDGYRKSAQQHKEYDYHIKSAVYENDEFRYNSLTGDVDHKPNLKNPGKIIGAFALCKRKSSSRPNYMFVRYQEYYAGNKDLFTGEIKKRRFKDYQTGQWKEDAMKETTWDTKPVTMIEKVAEAQCLRMTFQELFAGTYDESEINEREIENQQNDYGYDAEEAERIQKAIQASSTLVELKKVQGDFINAYQKNKINAAETENLKKEFSMKKTALETERKTEKEIEEIFDAKVENVEVAKTDEVIEAEIIDTKIPRTRKVELHGTDDPCDDVDCPIHRKL